MQWGSCPSMWKCQYATKGYSDTTECKLQYTALRVACTHTLQMLSVNAQSFCQDFSCLWFLWEKNILFSVTCCLNMASKCISLVWLCIAVSCGGCLSTDDTSLHSQNINGAFRFYLRQRGDVVIAVCLSVCPSAEPRKYPFDLERLWINFKSFFSLSLTWPDSA